MFKVTMGYYQLDYKTFIFNGGEVFVKLNDVNTLLPSTKIYIKGNIERSESLMELLMLTDALRRTYPGQPIDLTIPYFPYARQDRQMESGQSLSVKVVADIINSQNYESVTIYDAHSDVTPALLNNCQNIPQYLFVRDFLKMRALGDCILVAPDSGALKKTFKAANVLSLDIVRADKNRDVRTGEILETVVYTDHVDDRDFLIVDDICDGGRTFIELAKVLKTKTKGKVYLYVTHGIFANGLDVFDGVIDKVYCRNVFSTVKDHPLLQRWES